MDRWQQMLIELHIVQASAVIDFISEGNTSWLRLLLELCKKRNIALQLLLLVVCVVGTIALVSQLDDLDLWEDIMYLFLLNGE